MVVPAVTAPGILPGRQTGTRIVPGMARPHQRVADLLGRPVPELSNSLAVEASVPDQEVTANRGWRRRRPRPTPSSPAARTVSEVTWGLRLGAWHQPSRPGGVGDAPPLVDDLPMMVPG